MFKSKDSATPCSYGLDRIFSQKALQQINHEKENLLAKKRTKSPNQYTDNKPVMADFHTERANKLTSRPQTCGNPNFPNTPGGGQINPALAKIEYTNAAHFPI